MIDWDNKQNESISFLLVEIELVIVNGLSMHEMYEKLAKKIAQMPDLNEEESPMNKVKIPGERLVEIFDNSYAKINE